jgi:hypothetical protein
MRRHAENSRTVRRWTDIARKAREARSGATAVEFALVAPIFFGLIFSRSGGSISSTHRSTPQPRRPQGSSEPVRFKRRISPKSSFSMRCATGSSSSEIATIPLRSKCRDSRALRRSPRTLRPSLAPTMDPPKCRRCPMIPVRIMMSSGCASAFFTKQSIRRLGRTWLTGRTASGGSTEIICFGMSLIPDRRTRSAS